MCRKIYYIHLKALRGFVHKCICVLCAYVRSRVTRSILACFFAVKACLAGFLGFFLGRNERCFGVVFVKGVSFTPFVRLPICDSVWSGLPALNSLHPIHCCWRVL